MTNDKPGTQASPAWPSAVVIKNRYIINVLYLYSYHNKS